MRKLEVGDVVMTEWDDSDKPIRAVIRKAYRGHRGAKYQVRMEDGSLEVITADQIVGGVNVR